MGAFDRGEITLVKRQFEDIEVVGVDVQVSQEAEAESLPSQIILVLSAAAPYEWAAYFNTTWEMYIYPMKREAFVVGNRLTIRCTLEELERHHLAELRKAILITNLEYDEYLAGHQVS